MFFLHTVFQQAAATIHHMLWLSVPQEVQPCLDSILGYMHVLHLSSQLSFIATG